MEITDKLSLADYLWIRKLRNENRHLMTGNTAPISIGRQLWFWFRKPKNISLYLVRHNGQRAGYLLLREFAPGCAYITECIALDQQKKGLAQKLVLHAMTLYKRLDAEILPNNSASIRLHTRNGFVLVSAGPIHRYVWSK